MSSIKKPLIWVIALLRKARSWISDYLQKPLNKRVFLVVIVTVIASELFIVTDIGPFRFSIGTVVFVYAILSLNQMLIIPTAVLVSLSTLLLRITLDYYFWLPREYFTFIVAHQYSGLVYFLMLSLILKAGRIKGGGRLLTLSLLAYLTVAVTVSNFVEAAIRVPLKEIVSPANILILLFMSAVQVFLVSSLVQISQFQKTLVLDEQQRDSYEKMLIVASELYDELFYMQKSTENMENIMAKSYNLHKKLKELKLADRSIEHEALEVAEEVHEVKKDTIRILAGLSEVLKIREDRQVIGLADLLDLVIRTNRSYSNSLEKKVQFYFQVNRDLDIEQIYPMLAILNNLVSNAVEAINEEGYIRLTARSRGTILRMEICDNGQPVKKRDRALIFEPGYTTKFSDEGVPSTGIGLAYVKGLAESFSGKVFFRERDQEKCFIILLPIRSIAGGSDK